MFIVAGVFSVLQMLITLIGGIASADGYAGAVVTAVLSALIALPLVPFTWVGLFLNWKAMLIGVIAPIPIVSSIIESFRGLVFAVKAFMVIVKKQDVLLVGSREEIEQIQREQELEDKNNNAIDNDDIYQPRTTPAEAPAPTYVRDLATDQVFYVDKGLNGTLYLPDRGNCVLRPSDVSGRYHDDYGNNYTA